MFKEFLKESINDKGIFKAIFMAGGPGSGKSFVSDKIFKGSGARVVNSDELLEFLIKKEDLPLKFDPDKAEIYAKQMDIRAKAKDLVKTKQQNYTDGMLPLIIDGTGRDFNTIKDKAEQLKSMGYDTYMVFVNTSLDVAKERNKMRARSVPDEIVEKGWHQVQNVMGKFQSYFNGNFTIVDNSKVLDGKELQDFTLKLNKLGNKILYSKVENPIGKTVIRFLNTTGGKYLSDYRNFVKNSNQIKESKTMNYKEYLMERFLSESKIQTYEELASEIKKSILKAFPDTGVQVGVDTIFGKKFFEVFFTVGKDKSEYMTDDGMMTSEHSDPFRAWWSTPPGSIDDENTLPDVMTFEAHNANKYFDDHFKSHNTGIRRNVTKKVDDVPKYFYDTFKKVKSLMSSNKENMPKHLQYKL